MNTIIDLCDHINDNMDNILQDIQMLTCSYFADRKNELENFIDGDIIRFDLHVSYPIEVLREHMKDL